MKRTIIIIGAVALMIFLIVRMIVIHSGEVDDAKHEFVSKLGYDLSARIDSVGLFNKNAPVGFLYVTITRGTFENNEKKVARKVKDPSRIHWRYLVPRKGKGIEIFHKDANKLQQGDSLVINSDKDLLVIFRNGSKVSESVISENLRGD
jgi:hypothetical protein